MDRSSEVDGHEQFVAPRDGRAQCFERGDDRGTRDRGDLVPEPETTPTLSPDEHEDRTTEQTDEEANDARLDGESVFGNGLDGGLLDDH